MTCKSTVCDRSFVKTDCVNRREIRWNFTGCVEVGKRPNNLTLFVDVIMEVGFTEPIVRLELGFKYAIGRDAVEAGAAAVLGRGSV